MARFDVYRRFGSEDYLLDCQADILRYLETCFTVPLFPYANAPLPLVSRLNPIVVIDGNRYVMMTQYASAIRRQQMGERIAHLADQQDEIMNALDMLLTGY